MKIRIISSREEINSIRPTEKAVHMAFRASNVDFLNLVQKAPRLQMVQVPTSYMKTMSNAIEVFLDMQGIGLLQGDVWGHRKDLDEYFTVEDATIEEIRSLAAGGASMDDVTDKIQKKTRLNPDLIKFIATTKITAWVKRQASFFLYPELLSIFRSGQFPRSINKSNWLLYPIGPETHAIPQITWFFFRAIHPRGLDRYLAGVSNPPWVTDHRL